MLGCGRRVAQSPFSTSLGCATWYRPHLEKKMVGVEKTPLPRNVGLAFSSPFVLLFSKRLVLAFILFCPAGNSLGAFPLLSFPPVFQHPGVLWVSLVFFQVKFPVSTSQLLPKPQCSAPGALGCAGGTGCQWDAPGQGPGTAFGDCSPQEGLPDWRISLPFGAECFSHCLWVKHSLWSSLAPPCRGLSSINNQLLFPCCWNFLF